MKVNRSSKWFLVISMVLILVIGSLLLGCSSSTPSTTQAPPPATTSAAPKTSAAPSTTAAAPPSTSVAPATSAAAKVITLSMAPGNANPPPALGMTLQATDIMNIFMQKSNGAVKVDIYWAQSLAKGADLVTATGTGIADLAQLNAHQETGKLPLSNVGQLPGIGTSMWPRLNAFWELMNQQPLLGEYDKYNLRPFTAELISDQCIISRVPLRSVADLKGKRIGASGIVGETIQKLGAVPVSLTPGEQYDGLSKGTIDANVAPPAAINDFKFYEVAKYFYNIQLGFRLQPLVINKDSWNKLPADVQKAATAAVPEMLRKAYDDNAYSDDVAFKAMKANNVEFIEPSDADKAALQQVQAGQADAWAATQDKAGVPGTKILSDFRAIEDKWEKLGTTPK